MNTGISTYIWVLCKNKPAERVKKLQLIDASQCFEPRRKSIGNKRNDITDQCRDLIVQAYSEFKDNETYVDKERPDTEFFAFIAENKKDKKYPFAVVTKLRSLLGIIEHAAKECFVDPYNKESGFAPDPNLRDTENVPLEWEIDEYMETEVLPYVKDAWVDRTKTKIGYEIPMTRYFYKYVQPQKSEDLLNEIQGLESEISDSLKKIFYRE